MTMKKITTAVLAALAAASFASMGYAQVRAGAGVGVNAGVGAGANVGGANASTSGQANANGQFTTDRDFGRDRARERMSAEGRAHEQATTNTHAKRKGQQTGHVSSSTRIDVDAKARANSE
jgi:hypothetical protein